MAEKTVKLAPADYRVDSFDPSVEGVPEIKQGGTEVPANREDAVRDAAKAADVRLRKVG